MTPLRPFQKQALEALERHHHVLCIAPTGAGKSLIYETAAARESARTLLVSPLIALARQQHQRLLACGVRTRLGTGPESDKPPGARESGAWIVSPEKLRNPSIQQALHSWRPELLVVDECHCLWDWGDSFRPAFLDLPALIESHRIRRSLWLTATLPRDAQAELQSLLPAPLASVGDFDLPPGLQLIAPRVPWPERMDALMAWLERRPEPGIIFVGTRELATRVTRALRAIGIAALSYHAGMGSEERSLVEARISCEDARVVVATSAFGMGMNHPHLRWSLLWQAPTSLLALAQALGRAGRHYDRPSWGAVFWDWADYQLLQWTENGSERRRREIRQVATFLETPGCRRQNLRAYFGATAGTEPCGKCDHCGLTGAAVS